MDAERTAPDHNLKEIRRLIERIKEEIRKSGSRLVCTVVIILFHILPLDSKKL